VDSRSSSLGVDPVEIHLHAVRAGGVAEGLDHGEVGVLSLMYFR
jgi:hypothetical protein